MASTTASRPAPPPIPSHATFLLAQVRSALAHLHATSDLDDKAFLQMERLLSKSGGGGGVNDDQMTDLQTTKGDSDVETLGKNNAQIRKTLLETDLLCSIVDLAMNIAVPSGLLGDVQKEAILKLVEKSQKKIAIAVTDPNVQNRTRSSALTGANIAHTGLKKGWNAAGQSVNELNRKREESRLKTEAKKREKQEKRTIKEELKREREEIIKKRQMEMLSAGSSKAQVDVGSEMNNAEAVKAATTDSATSKATPIPSGEALTHHDDSLPSASDVDGEAMVSVSCSQVTSQGSVAATTTFSPWPGLLLTSTLVAINDEQVTDEEEGGSDVKEFSVENISSVDESGPLPPPPRRIPPSGLNRSNAVADIEDGGSDSGKTSGMSTGASRAIPMTDPAKSGPARPSQPASGAPLQYTTSPRTSTSVPSHREASQRPPPAPQGEVIDMTEAKQKSWTKKLGL